MSILDRLNLLIRSNFNESSRSERGGVRSNLREVETSLRDARRQQAELRRGERQIIEQIRSEREKADQWEDRAMLALRNGDEDLAREALVVKNKAMVESRRLRDQLDEHRAYMQDIARALEALEHKLEGTRGKMRAASSKQNGARPSLRNESAWDAELRRRMEAREQGDAAPERTSSPTAPPRTSHPTPADFVTDETFDTTRSMREFDRMSSKIDSMEADIEAMRELSDIGNTLDPRRAELDAIFSRLEDRKARGESSSASSTPRKTEGGRDDLADLKRKFQE
ncbi:hypothetical protein EA187_04925 [Lujinxingia sediminis]|uniref:PspA/IM30 family protein n=1 Tax=Lujinxingia sediminis TaxID=2480984 RepID=A0ABY0CY11_9DELT|nr:PspA/IM30 family protein [Lujinxingia sediminis]RVU48776.1 hypothetical protein EA187_04925 [Lujinxingia sediminis]